MYTVGPPERMSQRPPTPDLAELYVSNAARVRRAVRVEVRAGAPLIDDACQSAWMRLLAAEERVNRDAALAWLVTTAIHEALRLLRREGRDLSLEALLEDAPDPSWEPEAPTCEELVGLRLRLEALRTLPVRQRRLVWLQGLGLSYAEMAAETGASSRTVERQLLRGRHRLREQATADA